jgi:NAD(P)-dependent dehydrogenase (short-subunit alcohol dehydrogenase family)
VNLSGKVALITGARRVGGELAAMLAERGAKVALTYRTSRDAIDATVRRIADAGGSGLAIQADLSRAGPAERAVAQAVERFGRLDILVNMASTYRLTPFAGLTPSDFDEMIGTNLASAYFTSVAAGRVMLGQDADETGLKGKIVIVGDWATERPGRDLLPYITAKGALATFTMALAKELAPHVAVNLVQPSTIAPPPGASEEDVRKSVALTPLKRIGSPGDLNRLILFLLEATDFATGACYRLDGGRFLGVDGQAP